MKILLIGGTGVLSRDISKYAISRGMEVYLLNRGNRPEEIPVEAVLIKADIRNAPEVEERIKGIGFDVVVDFLSFTLDQMRKSLPVLKDRCKQYVFISSATAYSIESRSGTITEGAEVGNRLWDYANNKAKCEKFLQEYATEHGLSYTIVRPYVTYGDTRIPFAVISGRRKWSLANRILQGKPVVMWDDGSAICTLTHTLDFAVGIVGLFGNPKAENQAFHITSEERFTWNEVLSMIASAAGREANVVNIPSIYIENEMAEYKGLLLGDKATNMAFDNSKIKDAVPEFGCKIDFAGGIARTISYHLDHPEWMKVDHVWDARIDRLISKYHKESKAAGIDKSLLRYIPSPQSSFRDWMAYETARYAPLIFILKVFRWLLKCIKK